METAHELEALMQEPAGGDNHGRRAIEGAQDGYGQEVYGGAGGYALHQELSSEGRIIGEYMSSGSGWCIVDTQSRARDGGMTAHRGILHADEYVNDENLREAVEAELGFTYAEVHSVYRRGPVAGEKLALRNRIDTRILQIEKDGGNMVALGRALGFAVTERGNCTTIGNALARARAQEDGSWL